MVRAICLIVLLLVVAVQSGHAFHQQEYKAEGTHHEQHKRLRKASSEGIEQRHVGLTRGGSVPANLISSRSMPMRPMGEAEREKQRKRLETKGLVVDPSKTHSALNKRLHQDRSHPDHPHTKHVEEHMSNIAESFKEDLSDFSPSKSASFYIDENEQKRAIEEHTFIPDDVMERHPHAEAYRKRREVSASLRGDELTHREMMKEMLKERKHYFPVARPTDSIIDAKHWEAFVCSACTVICREFQEAVAPHTITDHHSTLLEDAEVNVTDFYRWDAGRNILLKVEGDRYTRLSKDDVTVRKELKHLFHNYLLNDYDREAYFAAFYDSAIHQRPVGIYEGFMHDHFCVKHKKVCPAAKYRGERYGNLNNLFGAELHRREELLAGSRRYMKDLKEERELEEEVRQEEATRKKEKDLASGKSQHHEYDSRVMYDRDGNVIDPIHQYRFPKRYHSHREAHLEKEETEEIHRRELKQELERQREEEHRRFAATLGEDEL